MSLSEISIRRPVFAWMLMFGLILFGAISAKRMGISHMPDVNFPVVNIALKFDNAAPEVMEINVVDLIEDAVMGIEGLKSIISNVSQGTANITCEFEVNRNIDVALQEVQNRIIQINNLLPSLLNPPVISKTNPEDQPILWLMLTADEGIPLNQQMVYARDTLKDQFSTLDGVGSIVFAGYVDPNLRVWLDREKLLKYELTSADVISSIQSEQKEQPAGRVETSIKEMNIRVLGEAASPEEFSKIRLNSRGGQPNYSPITLGTVAHVEKGLSDLRAISRYNGKAAVGLGIVKQRGVNAVSVAQRVYKKIETVRASLWPGYHLDVRLDSTKFIQDSVSELGFSLLAAALLTSLICYLFLGSWSSTINVLLAIPTSIVGTFTALYFFGFTLNTFTLLGLGLAIGIVVDDAIMMLENIVRHYEMGKDRREAAIDGSKEISFAAIATTLAIGAIFIPVIFMKGVVGAFFYQYGVTVTVAVFLSLLEALTLTPMRCSRFLQSSKRSPTWLILWMNQFMNSLSRLYRWSLKKVLAHRWLTVGVSVVVFSSSLVFVSTLRKELIPSQDQSYFLLNIRLPVGSSIQRTDQVFKEVERYLSSVDEVQDKYSTIGNYVHNNIVNVGTIYVILKDPKGRKLSQIQVMDKVRQELRSRFPGVEIFVQDLSIAGFSASRGYPVEFVVDGPDWNKLQEYTSKMVDHLKTSELLEDINIDYQGGMPEVRIFPDREKMALHGVSVLSLGTEVANLIGGQILGANTKYPSGGHRYSIRIRTLESQHDRVDDLNHLKVRNNRGQLVSLSGISRVVVTEGAQVISRYDRRRAVPVYANVVDGRSQQEALEFVEKTAREILPSGYSIKMTGSGSAFREAFDGLLFALILGIAVAYLILASQFNSFIHPVTILMALPFSLTGALLALTLTNQSISMFSLIGLILLMGIVKKNSILLVDFTNQRRQEGLSVYEALIEACPIRLRPIMMTSVATVAGAIPAAFNFGPGAETRIPMAISIIGGVTVSTLLTLYVVPCVYSLLSRLERPDLPEVEGYKQTNRNLVVTS